MNELLTQVRLLKENTEYVCWIPDHFAILNKVLKIKNKKTGLWEDGWKIKEVYGSSSHEELSYNRWSPASLERERK